jgi:hypothetical protein|eukprot:CAMPEP_0174337218 /NCGR_PEP_ID=MMETSP0810-20121108/22130_1 /TAXON_ID=73025 ORGANISM="Eutreptiella gymnastica-like, Strain CCMP1594" /NCGR_SAMPLE_ID=MMETSP0810 /ASSEMBLY_ACC=CAM_ASM_000659 /LENGTH=73 /DNA_ID=CAMNT_0015456511 /DNA_START=245 /DNA_END=466 /DNA_ORIENTATION=-
MATVGGTLRGHELMLGGGPAPRSGRPPPAGLGPGWQMGDPPCFLDTAHGDKFFDLSLACPKRAGVFKTLGASP